MLHDKTNSLGNNALPMSTPSTYLAYIGLIAIVGTTTRLFPDIARILAAIISVMHDNYVS